MGAGVRAERMFETVLWQSRYALVVAVVASALLWLAMLFITTVDVAHVLRRTLAYADAGIGVAERADERRMLIGSIVGIVDGYLITAVLFVFTLGLYRQFVSRPEASRENDSVALLLNIKGFHDLKGLIARMVVLILVVKFLQLSLEVPYTTVLDLLYLAAGILLVGGATYLSSLTYRSATR